MPGMTIAPSIPFDTARDRLGWSGLGGGRRFLELCGLPWRREQRSPVSTDSLRVALVQTDATDDVAGNVARAAELADEAAADGARLVALPEYLQYRGDDDGFRASARPIPGPHTAPFCEVARRR